MQLSEDFVSKAESVAAARHLAQRALHDAGRSDLVDRAALVMSELAANAVLHGGGSTFRVEVAIGDGGVSLAVCDASGALPTVAAGDDPLATSGRGLAIVDTVADAWGSDASEHGKRVWCAFADGGLPTRAGAQADPMSRERVIVVDDGLLTDLTTAYEAAATARVLLARGADPERLDSVLEIAERRVSSLADRLASGLDLRTDAPEARQPAWAQRDSNP